MPVVICFVKNNSNKSRIFFYLIANENNGEIYCDLICAYFNAKNKNEILVAIGFKADDVDIKEKHYFGFAEMLAIDFVGQ